MSPARPAPRQRRPRDCPCSPQNAWLPCPPKVRSLHVAGPGMHAPLRRIGDRFAGGEFTYDLSGAFRPVPPATIAACVWFQSMRASFLLGASCRLRCPVQVVDEMVNRVARACANRLDRSQKGRVGPRHVENDSEFKSETRRLKIKTVITVCISFLVRRCPSSLIFLSLVFPSSLPVCISSLHSILLSPRLDTRLLCCLQMWILSAVSFRMVMRKHGEQWSYFEVCAFCSAGARHARHSDEVGICSRAPSFGCIHYSVRFRRPFTTPRLHS